jgi:predicted Rossmann-fold nucleotide-binding protein
MVDKGFWNQATKEMLLISDTIDELLDKMEKYQAQSYKVD